MVRAKFVCQAVTNFVGRQAKVTLTPVTGGSEENKSFWAYTPSGQIEMTITNPDAVDHFQPGQEYYVDFSPAMAEVPAIGG